MQNCVRSCRTGIDIASRRISPWLKNDSKKISNESHTNSDLRLGLLFNSERLAVETEPQRVSSAFLSFPFASEKVQEHRARQIADYCDPDQWQCSCWTFIGTDELRAEDEKVPYQRYTVPPDYSRALWSANQLCTANGSDRGHFSFFLSLFFLSYFLCPPRSFCFCSFRYVAFVLSRYLFQNFQPSFLPSAERSTFFFELTATNHFQIEYYRSREREKSSNVEFAVNLSTVRKYAINFKC